MKTKKGFRFNRGVHVPDKKIARDAAIVTMPAPDVAMLSTSMALGRPAVPVVAVGDKVRLDTTGMDDWAEI